MNRGKNPGRPKRHRWVYLSIDAARRSRQPVTANPASAIGATRRAAVKSIVSACNRGQETKIRVTFSDDELSATFTVKI